MLLCQFFCYLLDLFLTYINSMQHKKKGEFPKQTQRNENGVISPAFAREFKIFKQLSGETREIRLIIIIINYKHNLSRINISGKEWRPKITKCVVQQPKRRGPMGRGACLL